MTTVLLVEDNEDLRDVIVHALQTDGRRVLEAEDGLAALELIAAQGPPDLILLDMNMPVMDGWQFANELRARDLWCMPVVVITAAHDAARSAQDIGAIDYLGKPFDLHALLSVVERHLAAQPVVSPLAH